MTDARTAALVDLLAAASRARDLHDDLGAVERLASGVVGETAWRARAADAFHEAVEAWRDHLSGVRAVLADLERESSHAATGVRLRLDAMPVPVMR